MRTLSLALGLTLFSIISGHAQVFVMEDQLSVSSCTGFFVDPGDIIDDYPASVNYSTTICPSETSLQIRLDFDEVGIAEGDTIRIFDGIDSNATEIILPVGMHSGQAFSVQTSLFNFSNCLHIQFESDTTQQASGWVAEISCQPSCQAIVPEILSDDPVAEGDNIYHYCLGDTAHFTANALFPENGIIYNQSLEDTEFEWVLNGVVYSSAETEIAIPMDQSGVYRLRLNVIDQMGCTNTLIEEAILIAGEAPSFSIDESLNLAVCPDEVVELFVYTDLSTPLPGIGIIAPPIPNNTLLRELVLSPPLALPDGSGASYMSVISINNVEPGLIVSDSIQLDSLWFNLEHSYSGDLDIEIICPTGQAAYILDYPSGTGSTNFGLPWCSGPVDGQSGDLTPGEPLRYNIVSDGFPTLAAFDQDAPTYTYTTVPSQVDGEQFTYQDTYFPAGTYGSEDSFEDLQGCPINGDWTLRVMDNLGLDNGHLFGWGLAFTGADGDLIETSVSWQWEANPAIVDENTDRIEVAITGVGPTTLTLTATDGLGCSADTTYTIEHLPSTSSLCQGFVPVEPEIGLDPQPWPNPFTDEIHFFLGEGNEGSIWISSATGQLIYQNPISPDPINTANWPAGIYTIQYFSSERQELVSKKVVKQ